MFSSGAGALLRAATATAAALSGSGKLAAGLGGQAAAAAAAAATCGSSGGAGLLQAQQAMGHSSVSSSSRVQHAIYDVGSSTNIKWHEGGVTLQQKEALLEQKGCVLWFTGLSGSGKSTVACTLEHALAERGRLTALLDGDNVRHGLNKNLGFSAADREENIRRIGEVGKLFADAGVITLVSFISPYRVDRDRARALLEPGRFIEVYMKVPIEICEERDPKGLYKKARAGQLKGFTGIDDPYEEPPNAELVLEAVDADGQMVTPQVSAAKILAYLREREII